MPLYMHVAIHVCLSCGFNFKLFSLSIGPLKTLPPVLCNTFIVLIKTDVTALLDSYFGDGEGPYHLTGLNCRGEERTLLNCPRSSSTIGYHTCSPGNDAGVRCDGIYIHIYGHSA